MHLKKVKWGCKLEYSKSVANGPQHTKTNEVEKVYILNKCTCSNWKSLFNNMQTKWMKLKMYRRVENKLSIKDNT